ncbi:MAG: hypothetical protein PUA74_01795 [Clostridiales bacterium]|nr:hypothetical protein [Clostridiales bacterium]
MVKFVRNKKTMMVYLSVFVLLLIAYIARLPAALGDDSFAYEREFGIIRSAIYIFLFVVWGISVHERLIQTQVRRYMTATASLMVFWFIIRTVKYHFVPADAPAAVTRYLWYLFYLPMLFIPLLALLVALSIGKPESYHLPRHSALLYIPTSLMFIMVMTNDLHQLVFTFNDNPESWKGAANGYAFVYYMIAAWMFLCALAMLIVFYVKCRLPGSRRRIILPCIPVALLIVYMSLYYLHVKWLRVIFADMTAMMCVLCVMTLELCIQCHFIQSNTHYRELFDASTVGVQITDEKYKVFLSSKTARMFDSGLLRRTENGPLMLYGGIRLSGAPIRGGHVVWTEDVSALINVLDELKEVRENLEDSNALLEEENALKAREAHIAEQDRLYNIIQRDTARQMQLMDELIDKIEAADTEEDRIRLLKQMIVIGAYLKRRSNLVFLADKSSYLEAKELSLTFGESLDNLELCGVACGFRCELEKPLLAVHIMSMYDFFEEVTERSLDCMSGIAVCIGRAEESIFIRITTDSAADFTDLASDTVTVTRDDDGEWQLIFRQRTGGGEK